MQKKIVLLAFLMIALLALAQIPFPVSSVKEERILEPISGSNIDDRTFMLDSMVVTDGFAVTASMDLPVAVKEATQTRFGFAVGLGDPWLVLDPGNPTEVWVRYTPLVTEMWLKIQGDADYSVVSLGSISDNTGTGDPSSIFEAILGALGTLFTLYDIVNFLPIAYEEPPNEEWQSDEHWAKAIVRQAGTVPPDPRLQTACASLLSYFHSHKWNILTITAEAEIAVDWYLHDPLCPPMSGRLYAGTYSVSFEVKVGTDAPPETPSAPVGPTLGYRSVSYDYSTSTIDPEEDDVRYQFEYTGPSAQSFTTGWYASGQTGSCTWQWEPSVPLGVYQVRARAQDVYEEWSSWSPYLTVNIVNRAPNTPSCASGPARNRTGNPQQKPKEIPQGNH